MPWGTVLYDQALNWELGYYLYDGPVYVAWFATPQQLRDDLRAFRESGTPRFLIVPGWHPMTDLPGAIAAADYRQDTVLTTFRRDGQPSFFIYQLKPDRPAEAGSDAP
jgi:hypothetical protein